MKQPIHIDEEFRDLLPTPTPDAIQELEKSILAEGCREPLTAWRHKGKLILLDGHTRHAICAAHKLTPKVRILDAKKIPDRDAAIVWILRNQLGRRNLTPEQFTLFLGKLYNELKGKQGGTGANQYNEQIGQNDPSANTAQKLGKQFGVSESTVKRAGRVAAGKKPTPDKPKKRASKPAKAGKNKGATADTPESTVEPAKALPDKDGDDKPIPEHLRSVFVARGDFDRFTYTLSALKGQVTRAIDDDPVAWSQFNDNAFRAAIAQAKDLLNLSGPHIVCVYCGGSDSKQCKACNGSGFLSKAKATAAAKELRGK